MSYLEEFTRIRLCVCCTLTDDTHYTWGCGCKVKKNVINKKTAEQFHPQAVEVYEWHVLQAHVRFTHTALFDKYVTMVDEYLGYLTDPAPLSGARHIHKDDLVVPPP